jgi:hypothetical protein
MMTIITEAFAQPGSIFQACELTASWIRCGFNDYSPFARQKLEILILQTEEGNICDFYEMKKM